MLNIFFTLSLAILPVPRQQAFALGITLSSRLCFPVVFRLLAFAFWNILHPLEDSAFFTVSLLKYLRLHWGYRVSHWEYNG